MKQYLVYYDNITQGTISVDAEDEEEAIMLADDQINNLFLCSECSGSGDPWSMELMDWNLDTVIETG